MSISTLALLLIANLLLSVCLLCGGFWMLRRHQRLKNQFSGHLSALKKQYDVLSQSYSALLARQNELEQKQQTQASPSKPLSNLNSDSQISRLISLGASVDDLVEHHGISRGEAELLVSLTSKIR